MMYNQLHCKLRRPTLVEYLLVFLIKRFKPFDHVAHTVKMLKTEQLIDLMI